MTNPTSTSRRWLTPLRTPRLWMAVVLGASLVASSALLSHGMVKVFRIKHQDHRISVTGSATRRIQSDLIVWKALVQVQAPDTAAAYKKLSGDVKATQDWLLAKGIDPKTMTISSVSTSEVHPHDKEGRIIEDQVTAYRLSQSIEISSSEIEKVTQLSRSATELIDRGVSIESEAPLYIYTRMAELKVQLLADASRDARLRAEQIARNTGSQVGPLVSAKMGVLQINPAHSSDASWSGNNDKTTLDKDAMAVVTASFSVE
jgi:hypothetical protein